MEKQSCNWPNGNPLMVLYHDTEWGVPVLNDQKWFEYILLDTFQAGLSWRTILHKRDNFRAAFDGFDYVKIANYNDKKIQLLLNNQGIIRNRLKVLATITNAQAFMKVQKEFGSFNIYIWKFVNNKPIVNHWQTMKEIPATSPESDAMSRDLKKRGFKFVGSTTCYAFMQAGGLVNDHLKSCFRYKELTE